jgi:hypothetical protein
LFQIEKAFLLYHVICHADVVSCRKRRNGGPDVTIGTRDVKLAKTVWILRPLLHELLAKRGVVGRSSRPVIQHHPMLLFSFDCTCVDM